MVALKVELPRWKVLCVWTVSTLLGVVLFALVIFPLFIFDRGPWSYLVWSAAGALVGLLIGAVVGYSQRRVLPPHLGWAGGWTWATALGWALGGGLAVTMFGWLTGQNGGLVDRNALVMLGPLGSLGIGMGQWLLLRHHLQSAGLWIVATIGAWGAGAVITLILVALLPLIFSRDYTSGWGMWAILVPYLGIPGLLTGLLWRKLVGRANQPTTP